MEASISSSFSIILCIKTGLEDPKKPEEPYYSGSDAKPYNMKLCSTSEEVWQKEWLEWNSSDRWYDFPNLRLEQKRENSPFIVLHPESRYFYFPYRTLVWLSCIVYNTRMREGKKDCVFSNSQKSKEKFLVF